MLSIWHFNWHLVKNVCFFTLSHLYHSPLWFEFLPHFLFFYLFSFIVLYFFTGDGQRTVGKVSSAIGVKAATLAILYETDHRPNNPFTLSLVSRFCPGTRWWLGDEVVSWRILWSFKRSHDVLVYVKSLFSQQRCSLYCEVTASGCRPMSWGFLLFLSCFLL